MLKPLGWLYGKIINKKNDLYNKGTLKSRSLGVPTFSVGNITVGGTGKTPLVAYIAEILAERGEKVCIISRGYKRVNEKERVLVSDSRKIVADVRTAGDEPFELANKLLGKAYVIADANRVEAGLWAREKFGITAFVLDDAFQHQKVQRDLDIVTIDATKPFGNFYTLPAGVLREPIKNLKRADLFIITRANLVADLENLKPEIRKHNQSAQIITSRNKINTLTELQYFPKESIDIVKKQNRKYLAFCALGNPENFFRQLVNEDFEIVTTQFKDHHFYTQKDIQQIENLASEHNVDALITTAKDAVKLKALKVKLPCYVAESELIFDEEKKLHEIINAVF